MQANIKFSIVTPTSNAGQYLDHTISSVVTQEGDIDIEYILVDNLSTDNTLEIAEDYRARIDALNRRRASGSITMQIVSQRDTGMYCAINRGFALATGEIFAWINADDLYLPGAFAKIAKVFRSLPQVNWLKGVTAYVDENDNSYQPGKCYLYAQKLIRSGLYGRHAYFIQQDSVFWRADLWRISGGIDESCRLAGDYDLWMKFAEREPLYTLNFPVSCFRKVSGQLSEDLDAYREEQRRIERPCTLGDRLLSRFFLSLEPHLPGWLNAIIFRVFRPFDSLYVIDGRSEKVMIKKSFKYMV